MTGTVMSFSRRKPGVARQGRQNVRALRKIDITSCYDIAILDGGAAGFPGRAPWGVAMSLSYRQLRMLRRVGAETHRTDPRLAGMLTVFSRLAAGEPMPAQERLRSPLGRVFGALFRGICAALAACAAADRWLAAQLPDAAPGLAATGIWAGAQADRPRLPDA
jgi:hypothetical protein